MTGPEHYRLAEKLLESARLRSEHDHPDDAPTYPAVEYDPAKGQDINTVGNAIAAAQVHATLALAYAAERAERILVASSARRSS